MSLQGAVELAMISASVLVARALQLRCPACGAGGLFRRWFQMRERCPGCGLWLEREEGYYLGAQMVSTIIAEILLVLAFAAAVVATWPRPPWTLLTWAAAIGVVIFPLAFYPFSKTLWLALDLRLRPPGRGDDRE